MKKVLAIVLLVVMLFCMTACGANTKKIDEELQGIWIVDAPLYMRGWKFNDGNYVSILQNALGENTYSGTYEIKKDGIYTGGDEPSLTYSYENGELRLFFNDEEAFKYED